MAYEFVTSRGFLDVFESKTKMYFTYCGNMGANLNSVKDCVEAIYGPIFDKVYSNSVKSGWPDYFFR